MKKHLIASILSLCAISSANAVLFNLQADRVQTATPGTAMPTSGLILLVADTGSNGFSVAPTTIGTGSGDRTSAGNFLDGIGGDDLILYGNDLSANATPGLLFDTPSLNLGVYGGATWAETNPLALVWFPDLTVSSATTSAGNAYGLFTSTTPDAGSSWVTPANNANNYELYIFTTNSVALPSGPDSGTTNAADLVASSTVVPEPTTFAALAGACFLGLALLRRRR